MLKSERVVRRIQSLLRPLQEVLRPSMRSVAICLKTEMGDLFKRLPALLRRQLLRNNQIDTLAHL